MTNSIIKKYQIIKSRVSLRHGTHGAIVIDDVSRNERENVLKGESVGV